MQRYNPKEIEPKWQGIWDETGVYTTDLNSSKPKYIGMSMFNYPSGAGIHIGHAMNYTISDVKARFKRQQGFESYHPVGWDAFGLPAENYAIKAGVSPQESMAKIIPSYHKQYKAMGWSNDWEKEISTHLPEYYKWSQWIFSQMYKHGLAYQDSRMQWWCTKCQTVLANEQVIDGKCWRHDASDDPLVEKKEVKQWFFKITDYADELLEAIDDLDWTQSVKLAQKNWIGKSVGAEVDFAIVLPDAHSSDERKEELSNGVSGTKRHSETSSGGSDAAIAESDGKVDGSAGKQDSAAMGVRVFTTRPDTLFGATFLVLAPEHELVASITSKEQKAKVDDYIEKTLAKSELERQENKQKTGVFTGAYAINPANSEKMPIWLADYVLTGYGTGAIMAVPAHDERDHEFAQKFDLAVVPVVAQEFTEIIPNATERPSVLALGYDVKTEKYCVLKWKANPEVHGKSGLEIAGGGIDNDEATERAAIREFIEETGYTDVSVDRMIPIKTSIYYTYKFKGQIKARHAIKSVVVLSVNALTRGQSIKHESYEDDAKPIWLTKKELLASNEFWDDNQAAIRAIFDTPVFAGEGVMTSSGKYNCMSSSEVREKIVADLAKKGQASEKVNYRMRDWSVSRQRYWGAPIPIVNCEKCGAVLVPEEDLPVILPELTDFQPSGDGRSALARASDWLKADCPKCGGAAERETDTLDTYVDSSFYMYRYLDPHNQAQVFDSKVVKNWEPIDFYNGADHATAHLLYARFIGHFFKTLGLVNQPEPFKQFLFNGKVTAYDGTMFSKSKGNGIDPLEIIGQGYGADALRTYLMFAAPLELGARWDSQGVPGTYRFLNRLWNLVQEFLASPESKDASVDTEVLRSAHRMIKKVSKDIETNNYNTAIAATMTCVNELYKLKTEALAQNEAWRFALDSLVACAAPFAPHIADELWQQLGHSSSVHKDSWPQWDEEYLASDTMKIVIQINGKLRGEIDVPASASEDQVKKAAEASEKVKAHLSGKKIVKTIYVPGKLVNFVAR